jgi:lysozyme
MKRLVVLSALVVCVLLSLTLALPASAATDWPTYIVKPGDNLYRIAVSHNVTLQGLINANGVRYPYTIYPGQILYIPDANAPIRIDSPANWQTVGSPITVTGHSTTFEGVLSVRVRDRWGTVLATVNTSGGSMGVVGPFSAVLTYTVPYAQWGSVEAYAQSMATGAEINNAGVKVYLTKGGGAASYRIHVVARGETLTRIALRYGTTWRVLASLNGLSNPNVIYVGQQLRVP